jgi:hypothetical protein
MSFKNDLIRHGNNYRNPLNNDAAPKVRNSLKRQRFRPYFTAN